MSHTPIPVPLLPDIDESVEPYLASVCSTEQNRALHRRAVRRWIHNSRTDISVLIGINVVPVWEDCMVYMATADWDDDRAREFTADFFAMPYLAVKRFLLTDRLRLDAMDWVTNILVPWAPPTFGTQWATVIAPAWADAVTTVYLSASLRLARFQDELLAVAWEPSRVRAWCVAMGDCADFSA